MLQIILKETFYLFELVWQALLFVWLAITSLWDWLQSVQHSSLTVNSFWIKLSLFLVSLLFSPFPWWTSLIFIFFPPIVGVILFFILFYLMLIFSFSSGIVFL